MNPSAKIAFIFPGQASQYPGMGKELYDEFKVARLVFEETDQILGFPLSQLCFNGPEEELRLTENTQPALLTVSIAAFRVLSSKGVLPHFVAGHSLGEYSALVAAESLSLSDAVTAVRNRGKYMQEAVPRGQGAMAAILGLDQDRVQDLCQEVARDEVLVEADRPIVADDLYKSLLPGQRLPCSGAWSLPVPAEPKKPYSCQSALPFIAR